MKFLIDENLPACLKIWSSADFLHVTKILKSVSDKEIWKFALENSLIILTKDTDFHERILYRDPPPKVILFRLGNTSIPYLEEFLGLIGKRLKSKLTQLNCLLYLEIKLRG